MSDEPMTPSGNTRYFARMLDVPDGLKADVLKCADAYDQLAAATAQHEARVKELQETVKRKDNYIEGITGALRKACEKLGCDNATDEVWKAAERLRNERDEARKLCEDACDAMGRSVCEAKSLPSIAESIYRSFKEATAERDTLRTQLGNLLARIHRDGGHYESEHGTEKACTDADVIIVQLRTQLGQALDEALRAENARLKAITNPANAEGHVKTLLAWAEIYGAECSCGECTHCAHYLPALQAGAVALAENARLREAFEKAIAALIMAEHDVADWGCYASQYFQDKHGLDDDVKFYKAEAIAAAKALRGGEGV